MTAYLSPSRDMLCAMQVCLSPGSIHLQCSSLDRRTIQSSWQEPSPILPRLVSPPFSSSFDVLVAQSSWAADWLCSGWRLEILQWKYSCFLSSWPLGWSLKIKNHNPPLLFLPTPLPPPPPPLPCSQVNGSDQLSCFAALHGSSDQKEANGQ